VSGSPYAGTWSGTLSDEINGDGRLRIVLAQPFPAAGDTVSLTGTWATSYADPSKNSAGSTSPVVQAGRLTMILSPDVRPACTRPFAFPGSYVIGDLAITDTIRGAYTYDACTLTVTGTVTLRRE
jgi:hypothetical protein